MGELDSDVTHYGLGRGLSSYQVTTDPSSRLATINMGRKPMGGLCPLLGGTGPSSNTTLAWAKAYLCTKWHLDPSIRLAITDMGRKLRGVPPFWGSWVPI